MYVISSLESVIYAMKSCNFCVSVLNFDILMDPLAFSSQVANILYTLAYTMP